MSYLRSRGEAIGIPLLILGAALLLLTVILTLMGYEVLYLLSVALASLSVGLGFIALGMAYETDKSHTELLIRLDKSVARLPLMFKNDVLSPSGQLITTERIKEEADEHSKMAAQRRLDEDTKRVGYVRGETYQVEKGKWAIHWGGKYRL